MNTFSKLILFISLIVSSVASSLGIIHKPITKHEEPTVIRLASPSATIIPTSTNKPNVKQTVNSSPQPTIKPTNTTTQQKTSPTSNTNYPSNGGNSAGYIYKYPTPYPTSINYGNTQQPTSQQAPVNTPIPVDHSLELQTCLFNAETNYNNQMGQLNARGMSSSGQADQVKSDYAAQQQSCHQQYGN